MGEEEKKVTLFTVAKQVRELEDRVNMLTNGSTPDGGFVKDEGIENIKLALINIDKRLALLESGEFTPNAKRKIAGFIKLVAGQVSAPPKLNVR